MGGVIGQVVLDAGPRGPGVTAAERDTVHQVLPLHVTEDTTAGQRQSQRLLDFLSDDVITPLGDHKGSVCGRVKSFCKCQIILTVKTFKIKAAFHKFGLVFAEKSSKAKIHVMKLILFCQLKSSDSKVFVPLIIPSLKQEVRLYFVFLMKSNNSVCIRSHNLLYFNICYN